MTQELRIVLADDDPNVRAALQLLITSQPNLSVVEEVDCVDGLLDTASLQAADVLLLDHDLSGLTADVIAAIRRRAPRLFLVAMNTRAGVLQTNSSSFFDAVISKLDGPAALREVLERLASSREDLTVTEPGL